MNAKSEEKAAVPETPNWATGSSPTGFNPPGTTASEHRRTESSTAVWNRQKGPRGGRPVTILLLVLIVALVAGAGLLARQAFLPEDVSAPVPTHLFKEKATGVATGPDAQNEPVAVSDGPQQGKAAQLTKMTVADMGANSLFIPALGVYMPLEGDSTFVASRYAGFETIKVPSNPRYGVWYAGGAPLVGGSVGTTLVASHVSQASGWGALRYLYTLRGGEMIYTKDAGGKTAQWQLTQMRVSEHTDFPQEYWSKDGVRQLVVVTCGGVVRGGHYDKNVFAIATPIEA